MYSEIKIQIKQNVPNNLKAAFEEHFGISDDILSVMSLSTFAENLDLSEKVIYAKNVHNYIFLVFNDDVKSFKFHVENQTNKERIDLLKINIADTFSQIQVFTKSKKMSIITARSQIYSESSHIITGIYDNKIQMIYKLFREDLVTKIYIPVVTFIMSIVLNYDLEKSIFNVLIAVIATSVLLIYKGLASENELKYKSAL
jgi:hypothetical protein